MKVVYIYIPAQDRRITYTLCQLLISSVRSYRCYNPLDTVVLYTNSYVSRGLRLLGISNLWDKVYVDHEIECAHPNLKAFWNYPKPLALSKERGEKVLYTDYDIIFHAPVSRKINSRENYVIFPEVHKNPSRFYIDCSKVTEEVLDVLGTWTETVACTAMMCVDKESLQIWRERYEKGIHLSYKYPQFSHPQWLHTLGQSITHQILTRDGKELKYISNVVKGLKHYGGIGKHTPGNKRMGEIEADCSKYWLNNSKTQELYEYLSKWS